MSRAKLAIAGAVVIVAIAGIGAARIAAGRPSHNKGQPVSSPADNPSAADSGVRTGPIPVDFQAAKGWQEEANQGHSPWMLEPIRVAQISGCGLGLCQRSEDQYRLVSRVDLGANGTGEALVDVTYGTGVYTIHLVQPNGPGKGSIWVIDRVEEKSPGDTSPADFQIRIGQIPVNPAEVQVWQEAVNQGHNPWMLDPLRVAQISGCDLGLCHLQGDAYKLVSPAEGRTRETEALVEVKYGPKRYTLHLVQPNGSGQGSIWVIDSVEEQH